MQLEIPTRRARTRRSYRKDEVREDGQGFWGVRTKWCDRQNHSLENQIDSFLDGLNQAAAKAMEVEEKRERERRAREIEEERRFEEQRQREEDRRRLEGLKHQAAGLRQSRMIRELIEEVRRREQGLDLLTMSDTPLAAWIAWATRFAAELDPVASILTSCQHPERMQTGTSEVRWALESSQSLGSCRSSEQYTGPSDPGSQVAGA